MRYVVTTSIPKTFMFLLLNVGTQKLLRSVDTKFVRTATEFSLSIRKLFGGVSQRQVANLLQSSLSSRKKNFKKK